MISEQKLFFPLCKTNNLWKEPKHNTIIGKTNTVAGKTNSVSGKTNNVAGKQCP